MAKFRKSQECIAARVDVHNGVPTVMVNDHPIHFGSVAYRNLAGNEAVYRNCLPSLDKTQPRFVMAYGIFEVGGTADFDAVTKWFRQAFRASPKRLAGLHIGIHASRKWVTQHSEEMSVYDRPVDWAQAVQPEPSWASAVWRDAAADFVESLVAHLHHTFDGRIILYQVGSGSCHENSPIINLHGERQAGAWYCGDFSKPMVRYFRRWLCEAYVNKKDALREGWGNEQVTFANAFPPQRLERLATEWGTFRSMHRRQSADYYRALSEAIEACVVTWAGAIKRGSNGQSLSASPIGSVLDAGLNGLLPHQLVKNTFRRALQCPDLDMVQSPASYALRDLGYGDTNAMVPLGSIQLAGKMWLRDFDSRTSVAAAKGNWSTVDRLWRCPDSIDKDIELLKRDAGYSMLHGGAYWWHEIEPGMYGHPRHRSAIRRLEALGQRMIDVDRSPVAGLGVFVDPQSNFHQAASNRLIYAMNYEARQLHWFHAGMACRIYHLDDAADMRMPAHRVLMVTNAFAMNDAQAAAIKELARRNRAVLIWMMAPGIQSARGFDLQRVSKIVGMRIRSVDVQATPSVSLVAGKHPWSRPEIAAHRMLRQFGAGPLGEDDSAARGVKPLFYADVKDDDRTCVLGIADAIDEPGLVVRAMEGYTSVYCAAPYVHHALLRAMGRSAGAHVYLDTNDLIHVAGGLVLTNAVEAGDKVICWPGRQEELRDLWTNTPLGQKTDRCTMRLRQHETCLLYAGGKLQASERKRPISR